MSDKQLAAKTAAITFETKLFAIEDWTILRLPDAASAKLPSRGQTMVRGTIDNIPFASPLEPDGRWSHWLRIDDTMSKAIKAKAGDTVNVIIEPTKNWPEPELPADIQKAIKNNPAVQTIWKNITPMARWEWIRWIRGTANQETRAHRIEVACSKMEAGERRPCCWNRNACSEPAVSKSGQLRLPS